MDIYLMSFRRLYISGGEKLASRLLCFSPEIHLPEELISRIFSTLGVNPCLLSGMFSGVLHMRSVCFRTCFPLGYEITQ